jgi:NADH-quinone oxidoreductase subunit G
MLGALVRAYYNEPENTVPGRLVSVSIMPCTAKKAEIARPESKTLGKRDIDYALTTAELLTMLEKAGISAQDCRIREADEPFSLGSGGGTIFGATGGVTEAVLRHLSTVLGTGRPNWIAPSGVRGFDGIKQATVIINGTTVRLAIVSGLGNADHLLKRIKAGENLFDFIEVMACPGGCVMGGGQPTDVYELFFERNRRSGGLYDTDDQSDIKCATDNEELQKLNEKLLKNQKHELLHRATHSNKREGNAIKYSDKNIDEMFKEC